MKNPGFAPNQHKFVAVIGDRTKFDPIYNYENEKTENSGNNGNKVKNFKKLSDTRSNTNTSMTETQNNMRKSAGNHDWWANRLDETKVREKAEKEEKSKQLENNKIISHGKKKFDFEEAVDNKRSYLEEFNVKFIY